MGIIAWLVVGAIAGWLAGMLVKGDESLGVIGHIVLGIVGAIVGGYGGGLILGRDLMVTGFNLESVVVAFLGAVALIAVSRMFTRRRRFGFF